MLGTPRKLNTTDQLNLLFDSTQIIVLVVDREMTLNKVNGAFLTMLGYAHQEILNTKLISFLIKEDQNLWRNLMSALEKKESVSPTIESTFIHKNGIQSTFRLDFTPGYDEGGMLSQVVVLGCDISKEKKFEKQLKQREGIFKNIFEQMPIGVVFTDKDGNLEVNHKFCDLLGFSQKELNKKTVRDITHPEDIELHLKYVDQLENGEIESFSIEKRYLSKLGNIIHANVTVSKITFEQNNFGIRVALVEDISYRETLEERNQELQQLRLQESISKSEREELQSKIDSMNRELTSTLMFISQRNLLLTAINESLLEISSKAGYDIKYELFKLTAKVKNNIKMDEAWNKFKLHFDQIHPGFFIKLRNLEPGLTQKELKHCAYVCIGLSNKETAQLLGVSPKSIEMARYRIKKKLRMESDDNLMAIIQSL